VALLAVATLWAGIPAVAAVTGGPCGPAQRALESGDFARAYQLYTSLGGTQACARQGLAAVDALSSAQQLLSDNQASRASAEIAQALNAVPLLTLPSAVRPTSGQRGMALAATLNADGFHQQAVQLLRQVIDDDPSIRLSRTAKGILGLVAPPWPVRVGHWLLRACHIIFSPILGSFLGAVALVLLLGLWPKMRRRLHLQLFEASKSASDADPDALRELVWQEMHRLAEEYARADDHPLRLDLAGPYEDQLPLGPLDDSPLPAIKVFSALAHALLRGIRGRCRLVTGMLQPTASLHLKITAVGREPEQGYSKVIRHEELGLPEPDPADDFAGRRFEQLAMPAAAWIILTHYDGYTLGGTRTWKSFTDFAAGWAWFKAGDLVKAEEYFEAARRADPQNMAATFNLGALLVQTSADDGKIQRGLELLSSVVDQTKGKPSDLQWYRSRYVLLMAELDARRPGGQSQPDGPDKQEMIELATELVHQDSPAGDISQEFVYQNLGAVLTLTARGLVRTTDDLLTVSTDGTAAAEPGGSLLSLLANPDQDGAAEKLIQYALEYCPPNPQMDYNIYNYEKKRVAICRQAIAASHEALANPDVYGERRTELEEQLRDLYETHGRALDFMRNYRRNVESTEDPLLSAAIDLDPPGPVWPEETRPWPAAEEPAETGPGRDEDQPPTGPSADLRQYALEPGSSAGQGSPGRDVATTGTSMSSYHPLMNRPGPAAPDETQPLATTLPGSLPMPEITGGDGRVQRPYLQISEHPPSDPGLL